MNNQTERVIPVLLGGDLNAYSVAYAFYSAFGTPSYVFARARLGVIANSLFIIPKIVPELDNVDVAVPELLRFWEEHREMGRLLLVPCADWYLEMLEYARDRLQGKYYFNIPDFCSYRVVCNKASFYRLLDKFKISYPKCEIIKRETKRHIIKLPPPHVIKPADSSEYWRCKFDGMQKVYFSESTEESIKIINKIFESGYSSEIILQERLGSKNEPPSASVLTTYSSSEGQVVLSVPADVILEEYAPSARGNYSALITRECGNMEKQLIGVLEKIGYHGFANFDILSLNGKKYCLELNPRQGRSGDYLRAAGINIAELLVTDMNGGRHPTLVPEKNMLWLAVPKSLCLSYCMTERERAEVRELLDGGRSVSVYDIKEKSPKRILYNFLHKIRQRERFRRYNREGI